VVINFTTTQEKIQSLKPFLNSILDQTVKVDQIALNILPKKYNIPEWYNDVLNIFRSGKDYGPGMNILPALTREGETDTIIISISSDKLYEKTFIENMVNASIDNPNTAFIIDGGMIVKPAFFDPSVLDPNIEIYSKDFIYSKIRTNKQFI